MGRPHIEAGTLGNVPHGMPANEKHHFMLIAMAGLPGTGKSTLAACLAKELDGVILSKDVVRTALFPPRVLDYSTRQDDITMAAIYQAAAAILRTNPKQAVILDGRTFLREGQLQPLLGLGEALGVSPCIIECVCDDETARARLERDQMHGQHPAANRNFKLYLSVKAQARSINLPHLTLDTGRMELQECVELCLGTIQRR